MDLPSRRAAPLPSLLSRRTALGALGTAFLSAGCVKKPGQTPAKIPTVTANKEPKYPFGSRPLPYAAGILPSMPAAERDQAVKDFYDGWKKKFVKQACDNADQLVVNSKTKPTNLTVSEAHGYGMIILAYMAGHDPDAKTQFDSFIRFHRAHLSNITSGIMAWYQNSACKDAGGDNGATDGDLDIAYGLLLADKQWGSCGDVNYHEHALWVMSAISRKGIQAQGRYPLLGDWVDSMNKKHNDGARVSDFMGTHFRAFAATTPDVVWPGLLENTYWIAEHLQTQSAPDTGLLPDFAENLENGPPRPARMGFLEGARDGSYAYNACRIPLRMGTDYLLSADERPRRIAQRINDFVKKASGGDPKNLRGGYYLSGKPMVDYETMAFTGPFAVGAMVDESDQEWLDALWKHTIERETENYYEDTLRMLSMIVLSGNWWAPEKVDSVCKPPK